MILKYFSIYSSNVMMLKYYSVYSSNEKHILGNMLLFISCEMVPVQPKN